MKCAGKWKQEKELDAGIYIGFAADETSCSAAPMCLVTRISQIDIDRRIPIQAKRVVVLDQFRHL
jgi:hypothetical protein